MLLALPLLMIVVLGLVGLADLQVTEQLMNEAAGRAARTAALGGSKHQIEETVRIVLGPTRAEHATILVHAADGSDGPVPPGGLLEVRIAIASRNATTTPFVPVSGDEILVGRAVMQRE